MSAINTDACIIGRALRDLPEPYKSALRAIVDPDRGISADEAAFVMRQAGLKASATSMKLHRRGFCSCR